MTDTGSHEPKSDEAAELEELHRQIDHTREDLVETVAALTQKADVKSRAREKAAELRDRLAQTIDKDGPLRQPALQSVLGGVVALIAAGWLIRRRRNS